MGRPPGIQGLSHRATAAAAQAHTDLLFALCEIHEAGTCTGDGLQTKPIADSGDNYAVRMEAHDESRAATQLNGSEIPADLKGLQEACFSVDTMVHVPGGYIEFFQLRVGDLVLSRHEETGEEAFRAIKQIHMTPHVETVDLEFVDKNGDSAEPISTTEGHPFWVLRKGWTQVRDLREGDSISIAGGGSVTVSSIVPGILGVCNVYNIEVEMFHTYFVGAEGLWVHNCDESGRRDHLQETATASVRVVLGQ